MLTRLRLFFESAKRPYLAIKVSDKDRAKLLKIFPPDYKQIYANHITLKAFPTDDDLEKFKEVEGKPVQFHITHELKDPEAEVHAVKIELSKGQTLPKWLQKEHDAENKIKHITISTGIKTAPSLSNNSLSKSLGRKLPDWVRLQGRYEVIER